MTRHMAKCFLYNNPARIRRARKRAAAVRESHQEYRIADSATLIQTFDALDIATQGCPDVLRLKVCDSFAFVLLRCI